MTKSTGTTGLILAGSPPNFLTAFLIAAKSTTAGTPLRESEWVSERERERERERMIEWVSVWVDWLSSPKLAPLIQSELGSWLLHQKWGFTIRNSKEVDAFHCETMRNYWHPVLCSITGNVILLSGCAMVGNSNEITPSETVRLCIFIKPMTLVYGSWNSQKKFQDLGGNRTHTSTTPVWCSTIWATKPLRARWWGAR